MANAIRKIADAQGIFHYVESVNSPDYPTVDWEIDPDVSGVTGVSRNYWKYDGTNVVVEMTQPEKDAVDAALKQIQAMQTVAGTLAFEKNGTCRNKWLGFGIGKPSNVTPFVIPGVVQVSALTFVNNNNSVETDIEVYKNGVLIHTWEVRNSRWAWTTEGIYELTFVAGDRVGVFLRDRGTDPRNCIVTMHYTTQTHETGEGSGSTL